MSAPRRGGARRNGRLPPAFFYGLFIAVALLTVMLLEYLDFRQGKYSFIFQRVFGLQHKAEPAAELNRALLRLLDRQGVEYDYFRDRQGVYHVKADVAESRFAAFRERLGDGVRAAGGRLTLTEAERLSDRELYLYRVFLGRRQTHALLVSRALEPRRPAPQRPEPVRPVSPPAARTGGRPAVAIIIDDVGYAAGVADQLAALDLSLTGAVIPSAPHAEAEARRLHDAGLPVIIHLPMESKSNGNAHPRDEFVLADSSEEEIAGLVRIGRLVVPWARGVNNHMGSLITSRREPMERVLRVLAREHLFFIDSKTAADTLGYSLARQAGVKTLLRDVFLDDVQNHAHATAQLRRLVGFARQNGKALAIGHPFPSTLQALRDARPWLESQNVRIAFAESLLE